MAYAPGLILLHRQMLFAPEGTVYIGDRDWIDAPTWTQGAHIAGVARTSAGFSALVRRDGMIAVDVLDGYPPWIEDPDVVQSRLGRRLFADTLYFDSGLITVTAPGDGTKDPAVALVPPRKGPFDVMAFSYPEGDASRVTLIFDAYNDKDLPTDAWMRS